MPGHRSVPFRSGDIIMHYRTRMGCLHCHMPHIPAWLPDATVFWVPGHSHQPFSCRSRRSPHRLLFFNCPHASRRVDASLSTALYFHSTTTPDTQLPSISLLPSSNHCTFVYTVSRAELHDDPPHQRPGLLRPNQIPEARSPDIDCSPDPTSP